MVMRGRAPNILATIARANSISGWVVGAVLARAEPVARAEALLGAEAELTGMNPKRTGSVKGAASALVKELVKLCQERYETVRERRSPPG